MLLDVAQKVWRSRSFWGGVGALLATVFASQFEAMCSASVIGGFF